MSEANMKEQLLALQQTLEAAQSNEKKAYEKLEALQKEFEAFKSQMRAEMDRLEKELASAKGGDQQQQLSNRDIAKLELALDAEYTFGPPAPLGAGDSDDGLEEYFKTQMAEFEAEEAQKETDEAHK